DSDNKAVGLEPLPEDLLVDIFERLSLRDQTRLGACCSRFRSINHSKVKRKFDAIVALWGDSYQYITTYECYKALKRTRCWMQGPRDEGEFEFDASEEIFFENSRTNALEITVKAVNDRPYSLLSKLFKTLQFESLEIDFTVSEEHNIALLKSLMTGRDLSDSSLTIKWSRAMSDDIEETRNFLREFPLVKSLNLTWIYWGPGAESLQTEVITDDILLYLFDHCFEELIVGEGEFTLDAIISVYEKLHVSDGKLVQLTARSEVVEQFVQKSVQLDDESTVRIVQGKQSYHEGETAMRTVLMTNNYENFKEKIEFFVFYQTSATHM
ncbi:hypothetical protein PMAYCL1PPCAC_10243, partial [Pristionchus mayeri]